MKAETGQVIGFWTEDVLNPSQDGGSFKYHLCVDEEAGLHLFVCSRGFAYDYPLPQSRCSGLTEAMSYVSFSRVIRRQDIPKKHRIACRVTDDYLRELLDHLEDARTLSPNDRWAIVNGIARHLNKRMPGT
jgi:hypothetical protein